MLQTNINPLSARKSARIPFKKTAIAVFLLSVTNSYAEEINSSTLEKVIVKGELQERDIQDSQTSVVIHQGIDLDQQTDSNIYDTINRTPGVNSTYGQKGFSIRGISQNGLGAGAGRLINVTVDGASLPTSQAAIFGPYSTWDLEQVEVLRGPQSTQSGRNAMAGAIHIRTANPTFNKETKIRLDAGNYGNRSAAFTHNQPLIDDELAIRVTGQTNRKEGWVDNPTRGENDYDSRRLDNARIKALYKPVDNLEAVIGYSQTKNRGGEDFVSYSEWEKGNRDNLSNERAEEYAEHKILNLDLNYKINNNWQVISKTSNYDVDYVRLEDNDQTAADGGIFDRTGETATFTQELKAAYKTDKMRAVFGAYYSNMSDTLISDLYDIPGEDLNPALAGLGTIVKFDFDIDEKVNNKALFGEIEYDFAPKWTMVVGGRYDMEDRKYDSSVVAKFTTLGFLPPANAAVLEAQNSGAEESRKDFAIFLPKAGLIYHVNDNVDVGFTYQKGYRAGGTGINLYEQSVFEFDEETSDNFELAVRSKLNGGDTTVNANIFYTLWKDMQATVNGSSGNPNDYTTENIADSKLYGAELEVQHEVNSDLTTFASLAYNHTEFEDYTISGQDVSGNSFYFAPNHSVSVGADYYFDDHWSLSANANWQSEFYGDVQNSKAQRVAGRTLINAKVGYEARDWSAFLYGRNLADVEYAEQYTVSGGSRERVRTGEPRFVGVQFNAYF